MSALSTVKHASQDEQLPPAPKFIERLFQRLHADYGTLWLDRFVGLDIHQAKLDWAAELGQLSVDEIVHGLSRLPPKFPPGLSEFKALCRPPVEAERAWHEAVAGAAARERGEFGRWSSPVVYWAYVEFGAFDLKHRSFKDSKARWEQVLEFVGRVHAEGGLEAIPEPAPQLPAPEQTYTEPHVAHENVERVKRALEDALKPRGDYKDWARRMIANPEGKSITSLQMAHKALGLEYKPKRKD